ncbi:MAG: rhombosortase [Moraxellaceae bacterium]|nr:MAG: rhombosortase [Moraxellaceae bacterium]
MVRLHKKSFALTGKSTVSFLIGGLMVFFATFPDIFFPLLSLERSKIAQGELWRLFTSNFVHFGWAHTLMNLAAFLIFLFAFINAFTALRFISLVVFCCCAVGIGVYVLNPEYETYAGLSGAIHGFFIAGFFANKRHVYWINSLFIVVILGKVFIEHQEGYQATELQSLLPVAVAYDAHLYGAAAGIAFGVCCLIIDVYRKKIGR